LRRKKVISKPRKMRTLYAGKETRKFIIHGREYWLAKKDLVMELGIDRSDVDAVWRQAKEDMEKEHFNVLKREALEHAKAEVTEAKSSDKDPTDVRHHEQVQEQVKKSGSIFDITKIFGSNWVKDVLGGIEMRQAPRAIPVRAGAETRVSASSTLPKPSGLGYAGGLGSYGSPFIVGGKARKQRLVAPDVYFFRRG
jgi:hypothetical protein